MQSRCRHCNRPYAINKEESHAILDILYTENLKYHNTSCPHCGKGNRISQKQLRQTTPSWKPPPPPAKESVEPAE